MVLKYPPKESPEDNVIIPEVWKQDGFINGQLKEILDRAKERNGEDYDLVFIIDGEERGGKSRLVMILF